MYAPIFAAIKNWQSAAAESKTTKKTIATTKLLSATDMAAKTITHAHAKIKNEKKKSEPIHAGVVDWTDCRKNDDWWGSKDADR